MRLVMPPPGAFDHAPKLQFVPILIEDDGLYPIEANRYLDERCNGEWTLPGHGQSVPTIPTLKSRLDMGYRLANFLTWVGRRNDSDWRKYNYQDHLIEGYQSELVTGVGSSSGKPLDAGTVNLYVSEACLFLEWAADRGYRPAFRVPRGKTQRLIRSGTGAFDGTLRESHQRLGAMSTHEKPIAVPSNEEVERWMLASRIRTPIKSLVFEMIVRCGPRISEATLMRSSCFPEKSYGGNVGWNPNWIASGKVPVTLRYGTKGGKVSPSSQLGTKWRTMYVPIDLADRIWHYKSIIRPTMLSRLRRREGGRTKQTDRLWLSELTLLPYSNESLRRAWELTPHCPPGWHPHMGRHYFAVERLCELARSHLKLKGLAVAGDADFGWLHGLLAGQIQMLLSPLLGHVSARTTMQYLRAAVAKITRDEGHPSIRWNAILDGEP